MTFNVALAEDNSVNRNTFLQKMSVLADTQVVFVATNGHECLEELHALPGSRMPHVVFMDLEMPQLNGIETIALAKAKYPAIHFIVLTVFDDEEKIFDAIKSGASGYLLKHEPATALHEAIHNVVEVGGAPMSPAIARKTLQLMQKTTAQQGSNPLPALITAREEEILKHMVDGRDAKRTATLLDISVLTVRKHIANIYDKLHVQSRAEVINMAHHNKWFK